MRASSYAYATGRVRSLEAQLLNPVDIERMIDAPDATAAYRVFNDTDFADNLSDIEPAHFATALDEDQIQTRKVIEDIVPDRPLVDVLYLEQDILNLKLATKEKRTNVDLSADAASDATHAYSTVKERIVDGARHSLGLRLDRIVAEAEILLGEAPDAHTIDAVYDRLLFRELVQMAEKLHNPFITSIVRLKATLANLKILFRSKALSRTWSDVKNELVDGTTLPDFSEEQYGAPLDELIQIVHFAVEPPIKHALEQYRETTSLATLEQALEEAEMDVVRRAKLVGYGPEVVIAYVLAKRNAVRNVRLIMTGKVNDVPPEKIKPRVRALY